MSKKSPPLDCKTISLLQLTNPERNEKARIAMVSLPVPMNAKLPLGLSPFPEGSCPRSDVATQSVDIVWWPDSLSRGKRVPRRRLLFAMSRNPLPPSFHLGKPLASLSPEALAKGDHPSPLTSHLDVSIPIVHKDHEDWLPHEVGELRFTSGKKSFGLRLGSLWRNEYHWWEWLRLEKLWSGPLVTAYRVGGCIETVPLKKEDFTAGDPNPNKAIIPTVNARTIIWFARRNGAFQRALRGRCGLRSA